MKFRQLSQLFISTNNALYRQSVKAVNTNLTIRNWLFGYYLVHYEQNGNDRAKYGNQLFKTLAKTINIEGISETNLRLFRQFYICYPQIHQTVSDEFRDLQINQAVPIKLMTSGMHQKVSATLQMPSTRTKTKKRKVNIPGTMSRESRKEAAYYKKLISSIPFSHFTELIKLKNSVKRKYFELLTMKQTLSIRELRRQINTLSFERLGLSSNKTKALAQIEKSIKPCNAKEAVKDLYFFEFLKLPHKEVVQENDIEQALLDHFQDLIMELGAGFCIEARQKKILIGNEYFFIDLVLYHRILKCHVLVELKADAFNHNHLAQLNTYVSYYKKEVREPTDSPPVGILLVADKNKPLVEFALDAVNNKLFVSKYKLQLPDKKELENFVKKELYHFSV